MRKPKSLKGPASKKERQQYKSAKGAAFPRRKIKRFPSLMEMYRNIKRLEGRDLRNGNEKAVMNYFFTRLFSPKIKEHFVTIGYGIPPKISLHFQHIQEIIEKRKG